MSGRNSGVDLPMAGWKDTVGAAEQRTYTRDFVFTKLVIMPACDDTPQHNYTRSYVIRQNFPDGSFKILKGIYGSIWDACHGAHILMKRDLSRQIARAAKVLAEL